MTANGWFQILFFLALILVVTKPLGVYMARIFSRERTFMDPVARPVERLLYRVAGVDEDHDMPWTEYAVTMLLFSAVSMLLLYVIQRAQAILPWNPQKFAGIDPALAFNTAASFTTNTANWQNYAGESTMSYLTQMAGLAYHNFVSAAVGIALAIAFIRGIVRTEKKTIGNFCRSDARHVVASASDVFRVRPDPGFARSRTEPQSLRLGEIDRAATCAENWLRWAAGSGP
jgi:K+-transporting ATPase ATPase A chain